MPSQFIKRKSVEAKGKATAVVSKTLIQINEKIGGTAWEVMPSENGAIGESMAHGGIAISKGKKGFTLSFVGTINLNGTKFWNYSKTNYRNKDDFPEEDIFNIFKNWFKQFIRNNKEFPKSIILFRYGLPIPQIKRQVKTQTEILHKAIEKARDSVKTSKHAKNLVNWSPKINYVVIDTRVNTRIFEKPDGFKNPAPGTVVFEDLDT